MRTIGLLLAVGSLALGLSACGHNTEQRAATGAAAGVLVAGPVGAVIGAGAGVIISKTSDKHK